MCFHGRHKGHVPPSKGGKGTCGLVNLRFVWWPQGNLEQDLVEYRMTVHLFGAVSYPSCACFVLRKTKDNQACFSPDVNRNLYIDNHLKNLPPEEEAVTMLKIS